MAKLAKQKGEAMLYTVTFTQYWSYDVEAKTVEEAEDLAYEKYKSDMFRPIAHADYDEVVVDPDYDEDEEEEEKGGRKCIALSSL